MPSTMFKLGGEGRYGVAEFVLRKGEVVGKDVDSGEQFSFPLMPADKKGKAKTRLDALVKSGKAALVERPARQGREDFVKEPPCVVYPGEFSYSMSGKGDVLYGLSPASGSHLCHFVGWARPHNDPTATPTWELRQNPYDKAKSDQMFSALFVTANSDEYPGLQVRWGFWKYRFGPVTSDDGVEEMGVAELSAKSGAALRAQYELLRLGGIIGKENGVMRVLVSIPGNLENYLPAVERVLLKRIRDTELMLTFEQYKKDLDDTTGVRITSLSKAPVAGAKAKSSKKHGGDEPF